MNPDQTASKTAWSRNMVQNGKRGNIGHAFAHKRGDRDQAVYACMLFYACLAGVTLNRRCINVDVTIIITIAIFFNVYIYLRTLKTHHPD